MRTNYPAICVTESDTPHPLGERAGDSLEKWHWLFVCGLALGVRNLPQFEDSVFPHPPNRSSNSHTHFSRFHSGSISTRALRT
jgi:hypothetical protein